MRHHRALLLGSLAVLFAACGPDGDERDEVRVMTRNLYLGANIDDLVLAVVSANPALPQLVAQTFQTVQASNPPERMKLVAEEIAAAQPHLVGLQEVTLWRTETPADNLTPGTPPDATVVAFDFLELLQTELAALGQTYQVASIATNFDAEVPGVFPDLRDVRLTDRDVILVRSDVAFTAEAHDRYTQGLPLSATLEIIRGWTAIDATVSGRTFRFVNTHLEVGSGPPGNPQLDASFAAVQGAQAIQLLQDPRILGDQSRPIILVGDFNSPASGSGTNTYEVLVDGGGFTDGWAQRNGSEPGLTCCWADDLTPASPSPFDDRIDLVLFKNVLRAGSVDIVGDDPAVVTPATPPATPKVASDHAGVTATLEL